MTQFAIKRQTFSWQGRSSYLRTVKGEPLFNTAEEAQAYLAANAKRLYRCVVDVAPAIKPDRTGTDHCQICGRQIEANTGRIAKHGYKRPGQGWQTSSCYGAGYRPYEVACDAIGQAIERTEKLLADVHAQQADWRANPPAELNIQRRTDAWGKKLAPIMRQRPEGFDPANRRAYYLHDTYEAAYWGRMDGREHDIRGIGEHLAYLRDRLAAWRAPS